MISNSPGDPRVLSAAVHAALAGVPLVVATLVLARDPHDRFARLLFGLGLLGAVCALVESSSSVPYSIGRVAWWVTELSLVALLLAFPSGRLTTRARRLTARAMGLLFVLFYLPTMLLADRYPVPMPGATCGTRCPDNALALVSRTPPWAADLLIPARDALTVLVFLAVAVILVASARAAPPLLARALVPVAALAVVRAVTVAPWILARRSGAVPEALDPVGWAYALSVPLVALSFGVGILLRRLYATVALRRLTTRLAMDGDPGQLRAALAEALGDPSLRLVHWQSGEPGRWVDDAGWPTKPPVASRDRAVTEIVDHGERLGAIGHDAALAQDPTVMEWAAAYAGVVLRHDRVVDRLRASLDELSASRSRVLAVADETRRRIAHDLHDSAQQRLIALRIGLGLQADRVRAESPAAADVLAGLADQAQTAIDEIREIARGIYPPLLAERGLPAALSAVAMSCPIPTRVAAEGVGRYPPEVESAVYFACLEAIQNAAKHAEGAEHVTIALSANGALEFEVTDDGRGLPDPTSAAGLSSLRTRLCELGGELRVESEDGHGTRIVGTVPYGT